MDLTFARSPYGELIPLSPAATALVQQGRDLAAHAARKGRIPVSYDTITFDRRRRADGGAVHHEVYDCRPDGPAFLIATRQTVGGRYGVQTVRKRYYAVRRCGPHGARVTELPTARTGRAARAVAAEDAGKPAVRLGVILEVAEGHRRLKLPVFTGFKAVHPDEVGRYRSVFDGSIWELHQRRTQRATPDHSGGFYYYRNIQALLDNHHTRMVFPRECKHGQLIVLEVRAGGRQYRHGAKWCASHITPVRELCTLL